MKENRGITTISLVITIIILIILASVSIKAGSNVIENSKFQNLKTNMLLIEVKAKEYVENANFNLGTNISAVTEEEKNSRIQKAKECLKGEEITDGEIFNENVNITTDTIVEDNTNNIYYYKLSEEQLIEMGLKNIETGEKAGWYIIKYNVKDLSIDIYNTVGFENEGNRYYSLNEIKNVEI